MRQPLLISGFMATGKSTVGRRVADLSGAPFEDLDALVEQRAGARVAEIFQNAGEGAFRELERQELERVLERGGHHVVALGGGALTRREARLGALERAIVVTLEAPVETLLERTAGDTTRPLLLGEGREARLQELLDARRAGYAEAHARLNTARLDVEAAARAALAVWQRAPVAVAAGEQSYAVEVGAGNAVPRLPELLGRPTRTLLVTDENVARLVEPKLRAAIPEAWGRAVLVPGEQHKDAAALQSVWTAAAAAELDRSSLVVALGGGVVSDVAGFAAATWMRGIRWLALPTTLLSMVDASVGGKTAVDLGEMKNAVGAFWQPAGVVCDVSLLETEPERGFVSALAEVVKSAVIGDPALFALLEREADGVLSKDPELLQQVVRRSIGVKARIVSRDERESGLRATLNLGHTLGHAVESSAGYARFTHGEAVSLGLVAALRVGRRLGVTRGQEAERVEALLSRLGLPVRLDEAPLAEALDRVRNDKKRRGTYIRFVAMQSVGSVSLVDVEISKLRALLE